MDCVFGIASEKESSSSFRFSPMLSHRNFMVLWPTFRSVFHFEQVFVKVIKSVIDLLFLHVDIQLWPHYMLKRLSLLHCIASVLLLKICCLYSCSSTLDSLLFPFVYVSVHQRQAVLMTVALEEVLKLGSVSPPTLLVFFHMVVAMLDPPSLPHSTLLLISSKLLFFKYFFLMWTIIKVCIELVKYYFFFNILFF